MKNRSKIFTIMLILTFLKVIYSSNVFADEMRIGENSNKTISSIIKTNAKVISDGESYPEGPLYLDGKLYFVEYGGHTIRVYEKGKTSTLWTQLGCGPASLISIGKDLLVSCYDQHTLVRVNKNGKTIATINKDSNGKAFLGPNDFTKDKKGGIYFSDSGTFDVSAPIQGKIYYIEKSGGIKIVATGIHYSNGLALTDEGKTLLVSEHLGKKIIKFKVDSNGQLKNREIWKELEEIVASPASADGYTGPDGLKIDSMGNVYICQYGASRVIVTKPDGTIFKLFMVPLPYVTNVALNDTGSMIYITSVMDSNKAPYMGKVYLFSNYD